MRPERDAPSGHDLVPGQAAAARRLQRLAFVLSLTPGTVVTMVLSPLLRSPGLLALGLVLLGLALLLRERLALWVLAQAGLDPSPEPLSRSSLETP